ncbi:MAG TPA: hypothetical protein VNO82_22640, partial [Solirubrobacteraceae bacterium]|nr:hypothetical protein [Solirubrobacteraceae bacterium]
ISRGSDETPRDLASSLGLAGFFLSATYGGLALMRLGIRRLRTRAAARRRAGERAAPSPIDDPQGRATVATLRGPGVLRVQLLWLRGDPRSPSYVEVRTLAEQRVEEDDAARAEDAVAALSEIAMRADNAHALRHDGGLAALGLRRRRRRRGERVRAESRDDEPGPPLEVDESWEPEPLTDAGQAEIARRLVTARVDRWSATSLGPLLVEDAIGLGTPPEWPPIADRRPTQLDLRRATRFIAWCGALTCIFALISGEDSSAPSAEAVRIALIGLAVAVLAAVVPRIVAPRRAHARLTRAVRAAAARPPRGLEQGLPGTAGLFRVARGRGQIALLHVRPARDDGTRGELEVRIIAARRVQDDDLDAVTTFCSIASDANLRSQDVGRSAGRLRSLASRLATRRAGEPALWQEPLAWVAAIAVGVLLAASIKHTIAGTWLEDGLAQRSLAYAWVLIAAYLAIDAARRVRDPFTLDA